MRSKPPKIAIYSGAVPSTTFIERLIAGVAESGYKVYLFGMLKKKTVYKQPNIHRVTYTDSYFQKAFHLLKYSLLLFVFKYKSKQKLDAFIKGRSKYVSLSKIKYYPVLWHQPDILHIQWAKSISDWMWVQDFGMKIIVSLRGAHINISPIADPQLAATYKEYFPKVDGFHAVSKAIAREATTYGAKPERIQVVYSGFPSIKIPEPKTANRRFKIVAVGRKHWIKGYHYTLESCRILKNEGVAFEYQIIGAADSEELQYLQTDLGLEQEVQLTGKLPFEEVQGRIHQADLLLLSSMEEGIANVVLEAMQLGTLVLSTNCGGMSEVIKDGVNGFLVPVRNPKAMATAIQKIQGLKEDEKEHILLEAKKTIDKQHSVSKMVGDMEELYNQVLNS